MSDPEYPEDAAEEVAEEAPIQSGVGQARVESGPAVAAAETGLSRASPRRGPRRVVLRNLNGQYEILRATRVVQSFCAEFEDVTRFQLPHGIEQQVRIHIEPLGNAREYRDLNRDQPERVDDGVELRSIAHPQSAGWHDEALRDLYEQLERINNTIHMVERARTGG